MKIMAWPARKNAAQNPYQMLFYDALSKEGIETLEFSVRTFWRERDARILHMHWPDVYVAANSPVIAVLKLCLLRMLVWVAHLRGQKILWTAHNMLREDQRNGWLLKNAFWGWFSRSIDAVIFLTEEGRARARAKLPALADVPSRVLPHGHYLPVVTPRPHSRQNAPVILFFGSIAAYKNVHLLLQCFVHLKQTNASLHVLGKMSASAPDLALREGLSDLSQEVGPRIRFEDRFQSDAELADALAQADLVVLPFKDVLNSGSAIFALSHGVPVLGSDIALFRELRAQVGSGWVSLIDQELTPEGLDAALSQAAALRSSGQRPDLSALDWHHGAVVAAALFRSVCGGPE